MADLQKTVEIIFMGKDQVSGPVKDITTKIDKVSASVELAAAPFGALADGILKVDTAIASLVVGGLAYAATKFASFEQTMLTVKGVMQASGPEYEALTELVEGLGETTKFTAKEAAEGLEFLARAGLKSDEAMVALPETLKLAQAATMGLGETADIVTNIMAGYGVEVEGLGKTNDVLTTTFTNSNTSLGELGQAFKMVGPVAASMGYSIEETSATLGILANAGYKAEMGGTALRNIMLALVAPAGNMGKLMKELGVDTEELGIDFSSSKNALKSLGVEVKDTSGNILPFSNILEQVKIGLENIESPADKTAALIEIFGKRGGPQMAALLGQGSEAVAGLEDKIKSLGGITDKIAAEMQSGLQGAIDELVSAFDSMAISIGKQSKSGIEPALDGVSELFRTFSKQIKDGAFDDLFDALDGFGASAADLLGKMAKSLPEALKEVDFKGIVDSLKTLSGSFGDMFDGVDVTTPEGLAKAIQSVIDTGESLVITTAGIVNSFGPMKDTILGLITSFNSMSESEKLAAGDLLGVAKQVTDFGLKTVAAIVFISDSADKLGPTIGIVVKTLSGFADGISLLFHTAKLLVIEIVDQALTASDLFNKVFLFGKFTDDIDIAKKALSLWKKDVKQDMGEAADSGIKNLTGLSTNFAGLGESADESKKKVSTALDDFFKDIDKEQFVDVKAVADAESIVSTKESFKVIIQDPVTGRDNVVTIEVPVTPSGIDKAKKDIEEIPTEKMLEIRLQGDIDTKLAEIETRAETVQTAMEWTAKVDIAEIEAAAQMTEAAFDSMGVSVTALAGSTSSMFGDLLSGWGDLSNLDQNEFFNVFEDQQDSQDRLINAQIELATAQKDYLLAKTNSYQNGDAQITIDGSSISPTLQLLLDEILTEWQGKIVADESAALLLGLL